MSAAQPTSQVIEVFDLEEKTKISYNSIREAVIALNISSHKTKFLIILEIINRILIKVDILLFSNKL